MQAEYNQSNHMSVWVKEREPAHKYPGRKLNIVLDISWKISHYNHEIVNLAKKSIQQTLSSCHVLALSTGPSTGLPAVNQRPWRLHSNGDTDNGATNLKIRL